MPYRRRGDALEVATAEGPMHVAVGPDHLELRVADRSLDVAAERAIVRSGSRVEQLAIAGRVIVTRSVPRGDLAIWIEDRTGGMYRGFGVAPLGELDAVASVVRASLRGRAGDVVRSAELGTGRGSGRLLVAELADRHVVYASRLFRAHAVPVLAMYRDGHVAFEHADDIRVDGLAIDVHDDGVRFTRGAQRARVALPSVAPDVRAELADRLRGLAARL